MAQMAGRASVEFYVGLAHQSARRETERSSKRGSFRDQDVPKWIGCFRFKVGS
jgi:hypothetical protein